jgi:hypothetical protein
MFNKLKYLLNALCSKYLIEVAFVKIDPPNSVPELIESKYVQYNEATGVIDFVDEANASVFGYILGSTLCKKLQKTVQTNTIQISLVSVNDRQMINYIQNGPPLNQPTT